MKIAVASNSYKEVETSFNVNRLICKEIKKQLPDSQLVNVPISDGGDGFLDFFLHHFDNSEIFKTHVNDPLMRPIEAKYCIIRDKGKRTAVIEFAEASGLKRLKHDERLLMKTSSYGTGELILDAIDKQCSKIIIGLGGAGTSDAGIGACCAMGMNIIDKHGTLLNKERNCSYGAELLPIIKKIETKDFLKNLENVEIEFVSDVTNFLLGDSGSAYVFAQQKGASAKEVKEIEKGLTNIKNIIYSSKKMNVDVKYMGAAGGFAVFFKSLCSSKVYGGIDYTLNSINFQNTVRKFDFVVTGEGKLDSSTIYGKAPIGVSKICKKEGIKVYGIFGAVNSENSFNEFFDTIVDSSKFHKSNIDVSNGYHCEVLIPSLLRKSTRMILDYHLQNN